jgi:hypothetical protein
MKKLLQLVVVVSLTIGLSAQAQAAKCGGVSMPDRATVGGTELVLNGMGVRIATFMKIKVYVAALYLERPSGEASEILASDSARRLSLAFLRDVDKSDIAEAYTEGFQKGAGDDYARLRPDLERLIGWMSAVERGDTHTYTYIPGEGLEVRVDRERKGIIEGADFAEAFFRIWLGAEPPNSELKRGLLGGLCG